ncbi:MAG TPA: nucleotidyltransferase family protein [Terracidiphilus sp.]|jgi:CTP:molybdopterin cytidylyltransferase MocA|nr:nucleotidyltransferase family protein [Terracidiphilus sp.]
MPVAAIILAAGASRRLGQPKQLVGFGGEALLERALRLAKEAGASPVLAVLGANFAPICASVTFNQAIPVFNERWEQGMSSSIHAGLLEADVRAPESIGSLVMTCDQPHLSASYLRSLLEAFAAQSEPTIVSSIYAGIHGIPAVFPRSVYPKLHAIHGDKGARTLLAKPPCAIVAVPCSGCEIDIDLPEDLAHLAE